jgi:hypothetical protein
MPVILVIQEAEIRMMTAGGQSGQKKEKARPYLEIRKEEERGHSGKRLWGYTICKGKATKADKMSAHKEK